MTVVDALDRRIIDALTRDARATYAQVGDEVGLSAPAVKRRVDRLLDDGVITGFTAVVDPVTMGWDTEAVVFVHCHGTISPEMLRKVWDPIPEVVSASTITGQADAVVSVRARDVRHLEEALERIRNDPMIDHTESIIVLSRLINRG